MVCSACLVYDTERHFKECTESDELEDYLYD